MTELLPGFDDWLGRLLELSAQGTGEDVATYVARAVASRMVADFRHVDSPLLDELLDHLSASPVLSVAAMPALSRVIADPARLRAVYDTGLLDSPPDEAYDRITRAAAEALDVPFAAVSVIAADRQYFTSIAARAGVAPHAQQTPLELAICPYALVNGSLFVVEDARANPTLKHLPAVRDGHVVAYLGVSLRDEKGHAVGTLHVSDTRPRLWAPGHVRILSDFAAVIAERMFSPTLG